MCHPTGAVAIKTTNSYHFHVFKIQNNHHLQQQMFGKCQEIIKKGVCL